MPSILFVTAHADDLELGAGGTCALLCAKGYDVRVIIATDDADAISAPGRRQEAIAGAGALGVAAGNVHFLGLEDGYVDCNRRTVTALRSLVSRIGASPIAVFTHSLADSHQDHVEVSKLARAAFRQVSLFLFPIRNSAILSSFAPSVNCFIDEYVTVKESALRHHASQDALDRICLDKVRALAAKFATGYGGRYCEPFELHVQNDAPDVAELVGLLDGAPFTKLWSPIMAGNKLTLLVSPTGASRRSARSSEMSDLKYVTQLQARLMTTVQAKLGVSYAGLEVQHSAGAGDAAYAERGNVLVLGCPGETPAADALFDWIALSGDDFDYQRGSRPSPRDNCGLLTIATNPFAQRHGKRALLFGATGPDQATSMAAALMLSDDARIAQIIGRAQDVLAGRTPAVHIEVPVAAAAMPSRLAGRGRPASAGVKLMA